MDKKQPYSRQSPFIVPEGYFPQLERRVMQRIDAELQAGQTVADGLLHSPQPDRQPAKKPLRKRLLPFIGVAASVAAFAVIAQTWPERAREKAEAPQLDYMISKDYTEQGVESVYDYLLLDNETVYDYATEE